MFQMKCPYSFPVATLRGITVGFNTEWSVFDDFDKTKSVWVFVDPAMGKSKGDLIPKIWWPYLKQEKLKQEKLTKKEKEIARQIASQNQENLTTKTKSSTKSSTKTNSEPHNKNFFNPFKIAIA